MAIASVQLLVKFKLNLRSNTVLLLLQVSLFKFTLMLLARLYAMDEMEVHAWNVGKDDMAGTPYRRTFFTHMERR